MARKLSTQWLSAEANNTTSDTSFSNATTEAFTKHSLWLTAKSEEKVVLCCSSLKAVADNVSSHWTEQYEQDAESQYKEADPYN